MKKSGIILLLVASIGIADTGCKSMKKSQKGAIIGAAGGAAVGAAIGNSYNKTALLEFINTIMNLHLSILVYSPSTS